MKRLRTNLSDCFSNRNNYGENATNRVHLFSNDSRPTLEHFQRSNETKYREDDHPQRAAYLTIRVTLWYPH